MEQFGWYISSFGIPVQEKMAAYRLKTGKKSRHRYPEKKSVLIEKL
jgi:hypothetical protein